MQFISLTHQGRNSFGAIAGGAVIDLGARLGLSDLGRMVSVPSPPQWHCCQRSAQRRNWSLWMGARRTGFPLWPNAATTTAIDDELWYASARLSLPAPL
jgi:hypothetical protein